MTLNRRAVLTAALSPLGFPALAQGNAGSNWPNRPPRIVVPYPPGGAVDVIGRLLAERLQPLLGQAVVVDNRSGAGGNIGADHVAKSAKDGYTTLLGANSLLAANRHLYRRSMPLEPLRDLAPVTRVVTGTILLVVNANRPWKTFGELIDAAKRNPRLRAELARQYDRNMFPLVNVLGMVACEAAYAHGEPWLNEMLAYVRANHLHFAEAIGRATDRIKVIPADSLYLAWMDCRGLGMDAAALDKFMLTKARVWLDKGQKFGIEGHGYMRVNLGCPRATVDEAIDRITAAVAAL